jgi:TolA-binding protein
MSGTVLRTFTLLLVGTRLCLGLDVSERIQFADGLYARGMYDLTVPEYESVLKMCPTNACVDRVLFRLGESYRLTGRMENAETTYARLVQVCPESEFRGRAGYRLAEIALLGKRLDDAISALRSLLEANPTPDVKAASLYLVGETEQKQGRDAQAGKDFERLVKECPGSDFEVPGLLRLGELKARDEQTAGEALVLFETARKKAGSDRLSAESLFHLAELNFRRGEFARSADAYRDLMKSYPADDRARDAGLRAAWASHRVGRHADALGYLERRKDVSVTNLDEVVYLKANCLRQLEKNDDAVAAYRDLLARFPLSSFAVPSRFELAVTLHRAGQYALAIEEAKVLEAANERRKDVAWLLAECYAALKDHDHAVQYYRLIAKEFADSELAADATYRVGHHLQEQGQFAEAAKYFADTAARVPSNRLAAASLFGSAFCLMKMKEYPQAIRDLEVLLKRYPTCEWIEEATYQKAICEVRADRLKEARETLHHLVQTYPKSVFTPDAHYWMGVLREQEGAHADAEKEFRIVLESSAPDEMKREARLHLATVLQKAGSLDASADQLQPLLSTSIRVKIPPQLLEWLAEYRLARKEWELASAGARTLAEISPDPAWQQLGWTLDGRIQEGQGQGAAAAKSYLQALGLEARTPAASLAALRMGELARAANRTAEAAKYYEKAAQLASTDDLLETRARAYYGMAQSAMQTGDYEKAARLFMSVAILFDDRELVPESLWNAQQAFLLLQRPGDAEKAVRELKQRYPDSRWAGKAGMTNSVIRAGDQNGEKPSGPR